jgi:hypothetical protein
MNLNPVCIFRMVIIQIHQRNIVIPDRNMFIAFPAADPVQRKPDDPEIADISALTERFGSDTLSPRTAFPCIRY